MYRVLLILATNSYVKHNCHKLILIPAFKDTLHMNQYLNPQFYTSWLSSLWENFIQVASNKVTLIEIAIIIIALLIAHMVARPSIRR